MIKYLKILISRIQKHACVLSNTDQFLQYRQTKDFDNIYHRYVLLGRDTEHVFVAQRATHAPTRVHILKTSLQKPMREKLFGDLLATLYLE